MQVLVDRVIDADVFFCRCKVNLFLLAFRCTLRTPAETAKITESSFLSCIQCQSNIRSPTILQHNFGPPGVSNGTWRCAAISYSVSKYGPCVGDSDIAGVPLQIVQKKANVSVKHKSVKLLKLSNNTPHPWGTLCSKHCFVLLRQRQLCTHSAPLSFSQHTIWRQKATLSRLNNFPRKTQQNNRWIFFAFSA